MLPALADLPNNVLFEPWRHSEPTGYPAPIVEHAYARQRALDFFKRK
jgi:deoxyribodipyrimidine photolyase